MFKTIIPIKGIHCRSCEILISDKLKEIENLRSAKINFKGKTAIIYSKLPLEMWLVTNALQSIGYEMGEADSKAWISTKRSDYFDLGIAFLILIFLYFFGSKFGLFNLNIKNGNPSNLLVVLLIGLTAGFSTCMVLIGGLVLGVSARHKEKHPEATVLQNFRPHLFFNLGRIIAYFFFGGLVALIGKVFQFSSPFLGILTIVVGMVMLILGLKLIEIFPRFSGFGFNFPVGVSRFFGFKKQHNKEYSHFNSMLVGGMTFFLPCGFTQAMQIYAMSTGNFFQGAFILSIFAIGTTFGLLSIGGVASMIKGSFAKIFFKFAGLTVILLALLNIFNGLNLTGWTFEIGAQAPVATQASNTIVEDKVQIIKMTQTVSGYSPNKFFLKRNLPVRWIIDAKDISACSSGISVPKLGIIKNLTLGENIIEFTPIEMGTIKFTCLMGMYPGEFIVIGN